MTIEKFKYILDDCHIELDLVGPAVEDLYEASNISLISENTFQLVLLSMEGPTVPEVLVFWLDPSIRGQNRAKEILALLPVPHRMVVDHRSTTMHNLLDKLGYTKTQSYEDCSGATVELMGGDYMYMRDG